MGSRLFWFFVTGVALVAGIMLQDGGRIISWGDHNPVSIKADRDVESDVKRAVKDSLVNMQVTGSDGREIDVPPEAKRAMADAIGRMAEAQAGLVVLRVRDGSPEEIKAATARRDKARADIERLKDVIERQEKASTIDRDTLREEIEREVREDVREDIRAEIREAVRN